MSMLLDNLNDVEKRIQAACDRSGRKREEVLLVAVSKTKPVEMIEEIMAAGIVEFGENKPQELRDKYEVLPKNLHFHMIGHLQTNKIKYVIDRAVLIHSIDSIRLAEAVNAEAKKHDRIMPVLVEVNVAQEESKSGLCGLGNFGGHADYFFRSSLRICGFYGIDTCIAIHAFTLCMF